MVVLLLHLQLLVPVFYAFVNDASKWVRCVAFQRLGHFLSTLPKDKIDSKLLSHYTTMLENGSNKLPKRKGADGDDKLDNDEALGVGITSDGMGLDFAAHCAFSFPAVTLTLGRDR